MIYFESTLMTPNIIAVLKALNKGEVAPTNEQVSCRHLFIVRALLISRQI